MEPPKTKEQLAYENLRDLIVRDELPHGEFLSQRMLTAKVGSTMVNVRPALRQLENDGLIESIPRWGVRIPVEDEEAIRDRYFVREVLEVAAVRRIVERRPIAGSERIHAMARVCDVPVTESKASVYEYATQHYEFHLAVVDASGSPMLCDAYRQIQLAGMMLWNAKRSWFRGKDPGPNHHERFLNAILTGSEAQAIDATREHIAHGLENELEALAIKNSGTRRLL
jgi:DNA-binding GntR family transcriptional regulator